MQRKWPPLWGKACRFEAGEELHGNVPRAQRRGAERRRNPRPLRSGGSRGDGEPGRIPPPLGKALNVEC
ncbi:Hypothetical predicted protein [Podarcis lilfordi]|uniref:Uncharacterized protein n=1 Tax=Podarcis lilfordi TaxID=74358 RepID=A0AA35NSC4_9SAUR|nr:Hypothetical predicted protein [Podarcis lilfordi]